MIVLQSEIAKELLSITDITIAGILLAAIVFLIYDNNRKDKKIDTLNVYIRNQDKETLKVLLELTNTLKTNHETSKVVKNTVDSIDTSVTDNNTVLKSLLLMIQNKLMNMK